MKWIEPENFVCWICVFVVVELKILLLFLAHYAFYTVCSVSSAPHFLGRNSWLIPIWVKSIMGICQNIGLLENDGKLNICQCIRKDRKVLPRAGLTQNPWAFEFCHNSRKKWENDSDDWLENERSTYLKFQLGI